MMAKSESDNSCNTEMDSVTASFQQQCLRDKEEKSSTEMESGDYEESDYYKECARRSRDSWVFYRSIVVPFKKECLCKEEDLVDVWDEQVKQVLATHGISCELNWAEEKMSVTETALIPIDMVTKAAKALLCVAAGQTVGLVELIVSGKIYCSFVEFTTDISEAHLPTYVKKVEYDDFRQKFENEFNVPEELSSYCIYDERCVIILSDRKGSTFVFERLFARCLLEGVPFAEALPGLLNYLRLISDEDESTKCVEK